MAEKKSGKGDQASDSVSSRRGFLINAGVGVAAAGMAFGAHAATENREDKKPHPHRGADHAKAEVEPFYGLHQGGIATAQQAHTYCSVLDLATTKRDEVVAMLKAWTGASARMTSRRRSKGRWRRANPSRR